MTFGEKLKNKKHAALNRLLASYEGQKLVETELVINIANSYFELLGWNEKLNILNRNIVLQKRGLKLIEIQKEAGVATELGLQQFKAANNLFTAGRVTYLDINNTPRNILDAELNEVQAKKQQALNKISLYKALCGSWK